MQVSKSDLKKRLAVVALVLQSLFYASGAVKNVVEFVPMFRELAPIEQGDRP